MPMVSQLQRKWMWANKPKMARRWEDHTPKGVKLPEKAPAKKKAFDAVEALIAHWRSQRIS